jgi:tetraacyldisaccharide 4'-kinase
MYGRTRSVVLGPVLSLLSQLYRVVTGLRRGLYRYRILKSKKLSCAVVSIGNLTLGGTGKTPMVIALAGLLAAKEKHPAVVSRGYGRQDESKTLVVSDGKSALLDARIGGDEPVLVGSRLPNVPVVVGGNRYDAAQTAIERFQPDTIILDDGYQHLQLRRDVDIVLVDAMDPFGSGKLFPAGILREPVTALERAHAVVITKADASPARETLRERIRKNTTAPVFTSIQRPVDLIDIRTGEVKPLTALRAARVLAFSGIARPSSFLSGLESQGAIIAAQCTYPDHHEFTPGDLAAIYKSAADERVSLIVTTEKDAVRLRRFRPEGIWAVRIELSVIENAEWEAFLGKRLW